MDRVFFLLLWPKREARVPWKQGRKKQGSITCRTDRANLANKMFFMWLCWLFRFWKGGRELEVRTATYGPGIDQSQHAKSLSHIIKYFIHNSQLNSISDRNHCKPLIGVWPACTAVFASAFFKRATPARTKPCLRPLVPSPVSARSYQALSPPARTKPCLRFLFARFPGGKKPRERLLYAMQVTVWPRLSTTE